MSPRLHGAENSRKILDAFGKFPDSSVLASFSDDAVLQTPVCLAPCLPAAIRARAAYKQVRAMLRQTMKQRIISAARRPPQVRLPRLAPVQNGQITRRIDNIPFHKPHPTLIFPQRM